MVKLLHASTCPSRLATWSRKPHARHGLRVTRALYHSDRHVFRTAPDLTPSKPPLEQGVHSATQHVPLATGSTICLQDCAGSDTQQAPSATGSTTASLFRARLIARLLSRRSTLKPKPVHINPESCTWNHCSILFHEPYTLNPAAQSLCKLHGSCLL